MRRSSLSLPLALFACAPSVVGEGEAFELILQPRDLRADAEPLLQSNLIVHRGDQRIDAGSSTDNGWRLPPLDPLRSERLGLSFDKGGDTLAWGMTPVLELDEGRMETPVWVLPVEQPAPIGSLDTPGPTLGAALAVSARGDLWIFGGTDNVLGGPGDPTPASPDVWRIPRESNDLTPEPQRPLTNREGQADPRAFATATPVLVNDEERIVVVGGRAYPGDPDGEVDALVFDPARAQVDRRIVLPLGLSEHTTIPVGGSRLLLVGGLTSTGAGRAVWMVLDVASGTSRSPDVLLETGGWGLATAPHPEGGAVACGGARQPERNSVPTEPQRGCYRIRPDHHTPTSRLPDLPLPLAGAALTVLPDGSMLLSGGITGTLEPDVLHPARQNLWWLPPDGERWEDVGVMARPRVHHRLIPLASGEILSLGGATSSGSFPVLVLGETSGPAERIDIVRETTRVLPSTAPLSGAWPSIAAVKGDLLFLQEGAYLLDGDLSGGQTFGLLGRPPTP